jgi:hypothetical protein
MTFLKSCNALFGPVAVVVQCVCISFRNTYLIDNVSSAFS